MQPELKEKIMEAVHQAPRELVKEEQEWLAELLAHPRFILAWSHIIQNSRNLATAAMGKSLLGNSGALEAFIRDQGEFRASLSFLDQLMDLATEKE